MTIHTKFILAITTSLTLSLLIGVVLWWTVIHVSEAIDHGRLADEITQVAFERTVARDQFFFHRETRALAQWHAKTSQLDQLLAQAAAVFIAAPDQSLVRRLRRHFEATRSLYAQILAAYQTPPEAVDDMHSELLGRLIGQILVEAQQLTTASYELHQHSRTSVLQTQRWMTIMIGIALGLLTMISLGGLAWLGLAVVRPLVRLRQGAEAIARGDFAYRVPLPRRTDLAVMANPEMPARVDELSALALAFNRMAEELATFYGQLEQRVAERTRELQRSNVEIQRLQEHLAQQLRDFEALLEVAPIGIAVAEDPECSQIGANPSLLRLLRLPPGANPVWTSAATDPLPFDAERHGRRLAAAELPLHVAAAEGRPVIDAAFDLVWADGTVVHLVGYAVPLRDAHGHVRGSIAAFLDVTRRQRLLQQLETAHARLESMLYHMPSGALFASAPFGQIILCNQQVERIWRQSFALCEEIHHHALNRGFHPDGKPYTPEEWPMARALRHAEVVHGEEIAIVRGDGTCGTLRVNAAPITDRTGPCVAAVVVCDDISELKAAEAESRRLNEDLEQRVVQRTAQLEAALQDLESFTYSVAHDLRAPLRSLQSFADLLQEDYGLAFDATAQDYLQRIRRNATRMDTLIRDLLAYSHLSATEFQRQPVALDAIVSVVLADLADTIKASGAAIAVDAPLPAVLTHEPILVQVVLNLLTNALKFVAPGTPPVIRVRAECRAPDVRIWVEDNGLGIPAEHQERIFRPFERLHSGEHYPGTGIGLAIVRRSLERLGGAAGGGVSPRGGQPLLVRAAGRARDVAQEDGHGVDSDPRGG